MAVERGVAVLVADHLLQLLLGDLRRVWLEQVVDPLLVSLLLLFVGLEPVRLYLLYLVLRLLLQGRKLRLNLTPRSVLVH